MLKVNPVLSICKSPAAGQRTKNKLLLINIPELSTSSHILHESTQKSNIKQHLCRFLLSCRMIVSYTILSLTLGCCLMSASHGPGRFCLAENTSNNDRCYSPFSAAGQEFSLSRHGKLLFRDGAISANVSGSFV